MNELVEPLARTAGIDRAVAKQPRPPSRHLFIRHRLAQVPCNDKRQQRFITRPLRANDFAAIERHAVELSGFIHDQTGTVETITMRLGTRGLNQFV
ncbi:hypothetical protein [Bradyrhizobium sp. ORS 285]|uniref:hypothetical protein n=1 Tax=Bradyrhizobium sp. ORS 285 TaxID=115808 RepID=UPI0011126152|nr:hypothetical protein [Bradyrhizobium sp. ORS 285]